MNSWRYYLSLYFGVFYSTCIVNLSYSQGLRANWSHLHHTYQVKHEPNQSQSYIDDIHCQFWQGLSLLTDTLPKKNRREKIEVQLDEIEKFIDLIDKHPVIIISDNPYMI